MFKPALGVTTGGSLAGYNYVSRSSYKRRGAGELSNTLNFHDFLLRHFFCFKHAVVGESMRVRRDYGDYMD